MSKLTPKERKFVVAKVKGKTNRQAYIEAYTPKTDKLSTIDPNASRIAKKKQVNEAIEQALKAHDLTPDFAIAELKTIVEQNKEIGAKRLAIKDVLELHGYKKETQNSIQLNVKQGFFKVGR